MKENSLSPWAAATTIYLEKATADIYFKEFFGHSCKLRLSGGSLWLLVSRREMENFIAFRTVFSPANDLKVDNIKEEGNNLLLNLSSAIGNYKMRLNFPDRQYPVLHYTVSLTPATKLHIPFWPKDVLVKGKTNPKRVSGEGTYKSGRYKKRFNVCKYKRSGSWGFFVPAKFYCIEQLLYRNGNFSGRYGWR